MFEAMTWVNLHGYLDQFSFDSIYRVFVLEPGMLRRQLNAISGKFFRILRFFRRFNHVEGSHIRVCGCNDGNARVADFLGGKSGHRS